MSENLTCLLLTNLNGYSLTGPSRCKMRSKTKKLAEAFIKQTKK